MGVHAAGSALQEGSRSRIGWQQTKHNPIMTDLVVPGISWRNHLRHAIFLWQAFALCATGLREVIETKYGLMARRL